jgi:hypothetical protein
MRTLWSWTGLWAFACTLASAAAPAGSISAPAAGGAAPSPVIQAPEPDHRFQKVIEGQSVDHDFLLRNAGQADLLILKLRAD